MWSNFLWPYKGTQSLPANPKPTLPQQKVQIRVSTQKNASFFLTIIFFLQMFLDNTCHSPSE